MKRTIVAAVLGLAAMTGPAAAGDISGEATVIDSDTLEVAGRRVMLYGLESIERNQTCRMGGKPWQCYAAAVRQLETLVSLGSVDCESVGEPDRYGRVLARCGVGDRNLNEEFVRSGFAVARVDEAPGLEAAEKAAAAANAGLWAGDFERPTEFRDAAGIFVDRP